MICNSDPLRGIHQIGFFVLSEFQINGQKNSE